MNKQLKLVLIISILASFVAFLDSSVVNVALPAISKELGGGLASQQWIVDSYLLTLGSFILVAGSLSDLFGRKKVLSAGLIGFLVASILCAIAPNVTFLIVMRAVQGLAGALLVPSSLAMIISAFSGEAQGKAIGTWTAWTGISFIVGPLLGGFLVDSASWRWVFGINVIPIAITLFLMKLLKLPEKLPVGVHVDIVGAILCAVGLGGPVYSFIEQPHYGWSSPLVIWPLLIGVVSMIGFLLYEKSIKNPMLPLSLFKVRNFSVGNIATTSIYAGLSVAIFTLIIFVQSVGGYSALNAGLSFVPVTIILFLLSPKFGGLAGKYGPRFFMAIGPIVGAIGFLLLLRVNADINYWSQIFPAIMVFGLGLSMTVAPLTAAILGDIDSRNAGVGSAINNAVSRIAGLIAIALIGLVIGADAFTGSVSHGVDAFHKAAITMAVLLLIGGIVSAIGITNVRKPKAKALA
ncbi:MAG TPA: MFS transporter [Candidatus Saccharimonadales bacterium]|nr:MFS transporter [Candidatus Saccharimonadales bacterium]